MTTLTEKAGHRAQGMAAKTACPSCGGAELGEVFVGIDWAGPVDCRNCAAVIVWYIGVGGTAVASSCKHRI